MIPNKRELQQTAINRSSGIVFKDFIKIYKGPYFSLVNHTTLSSDNPSRFRKNILK